VNGGPNSRTRSLKVSETHRLPAASRIALYGSLSCVALRPGDVEMRSGCPITTARVCPAVNGPRSIRTRCDPVSARIMVVFASAMEGGGGGDDVGPVWRTETTEFCDGALPPQEVHTAKLVRTPMTQVPRRNHRRTIARTENTADIIREWRWTRKGTPTSDALKWPPK